MVMIWTEVHIMWAHMRQDTKSTSSIIAEEKTETQKHLLWVSGSGGLILTCIQEYVEKKQGSREK